MKSTRIPSALRFALCLVVLPCPRAFAQTEVGTVASTVGTLEVQRGDSRTWQAIFVGAPVLLSDGVRTGEEAGARIVLRDDTVIDFSSDTHVKIERFAAQADPQHQRALIHLLDGKVRILLGARDSAARGRFEVETSSAIAGGRTAAFVVRYDRTSKSTDVVGVEGATEVQGTLGVLEAAAQLGPRQWTRVAPSRLPAPPENLTDEQLSSYVSGLDIIGTGSRETLDVGHPLLVGRLLKPEDRPGVAPAVGAPGATTTASYLKPQTPGETFVQQRSKDLSVVTQPLPEFRAADPDLPPPPPK